MNIKISNSAYKDIEYGQLFYERQEYGLGIYFQDAIFSDIDSLRFYAGIHLIQYGKYRLLSKKFPYAIYYKIKDDIVVVTAVLDCRRKSDWIMKRMKEE